MNFKSTLLLVVLAAGAGVWLWKGDTWYPRSAAPAESKSLAALDADFQTGKLTRIEITGDNPLTLEKADGEIGWKLPGNWPLRKAEVTELAELFAGLRSRFVPIPLAENDDLARYGLGAADKPLVVKAAAGNTPYTLAFGEPKLADGESTFTRSAYLRINDFPELIRLGPDVMPVLRRSADSYRRRQLFPDSERIKIASGDSAGPIGTAGGYTVVALITDKAKEIEVRSTTKNSTLFGIAIPRTESFKLVRVSPFPKPVATEKSAEPTVTTQQIADGWEIAAPQRDRVDAERLQRILGTIPDLWVEEFSNDASKTGLDKPERTLTVVQPDGSKLVLLVGAVAKSVEREETVAAPPTMPGLPPMPMTRKVFDEYRYAKLADNPQVFVLRAEKLNDLFPRAESLRDLQLAHFTPDEVQELTIARAGQPPVKLVKADAKWQIDGKAAEAGTVNELLGQLSGLRGSPEDVKGEAVGTTVTVIAKEKRPEGDPPAPSRTFTIHLGKPKLGPWTAIASATSALTAVGVGANTESESIPTRVEGWPRLSMVDAAVLKALAPESGFRDRSLTNFFAADKLTLEKDGKSLTFTRTGKDWKQTAPKEVPIDGTELDDLVLALGRLRADKFVADKATPEDLKKHGLDSPRAKWTVVAEGKDVLVLLVGNENFAKLATGDAIVQLPADVTAKLVAEYRSRKVWALDEARVETIEVDYPPAKFKLVRQGTGWEDPAAPKDSVSDKAVSELLSALGGLKAEQWLDEKTTVDKDRPAITLTLRDKTKRIVYFGAIILNAGKTSLKAQTNDPGAVPFLLGEPYSSTLTRSRDKYIEKK